MKHISNNNPVDIINALKSVLRVKTALELSKILDVSASHISNFRRGEKNLSRSKMKEIESILLKHGIILSSHIPEQTQHGEDTKSNEELNKNKRITLAEAHGICELCSTPAPFKDKSGNPYLLATMIIPSVYGGTNMLNNLVALCPNCAAKMDIRADDTDIAYLRNKKSNIL
jgi:hypothetical protein